MASKAESELGLFRSIWYEFNRVIGKLLALEDYIDVDIDSDSAKKLSDEEIVAAVNDQLNPKLDKNENMLDTSDNNQCDLIPTAKQAIQAIDYIRRFSLVMNDTNAIEEALRLTTILEQKLMKEKESRAKQATITKYFRPNNTLTACRTVIFVYCLSVLNNTMTKCIGSVLSGSCK